MEYLSTVHYVYSLNPVTGRVLHSTIICLCFLKVMSNRVTSPTIDRKRNDLPGHCIIFGGREGDVFR